jgi:hypothetical protein
MTVGFPLILNFWQMDRVIFHKSAACLMILLQSSNGASTAIIKEGADNRGAGQSPERQLGQKPWLRSRTIALAV